MWNCISQNTFDLLGKTQISVFDKNIPFKVMREPLLDYLKEKKLKDYWIYIENEKEKEIYEKAGQIIVVNSSYIEISNISINYTSIAIQLLNCNHCKVMNSNFSNNGIGIKCNGSYNVFMNNTCMKNGDYGIWCDGSFNHIEENRIILNEFIGMYASSHNVIRKNYIAHNEYDGLEISNKNVIEKNIMSFNGLAGISLGYSSNDNLIKDNRFINNCWGVSIEYSCKDNIIANNEFTQDGIWIRWWMSKEIGHNEIYQNTINGKPLVYMEEKSDEICD